jgi:hypothetical protein
MVQHVAIDLHHRGEGGVRCRDGDDPERVQVLEVVLRLRRRYLGRQTGLIVRVPFARNYLWEYPQIAQW